MSRRKASDGQPFDRDEDGWSEVRYDPNDEPGSLFDRPGKKADSRPKTKERFDAAVCSARRFARSKGTFS